jgi:hypothetical protein
VARSTAEAGYRSMAFGVSEGLWLQILLFELGLSEKSPIMLYCDNKAAINITNNSVQHDQTKYVEIDRHFMKEKLDSGVSHLFEQSKNWPMHSLRDYTPLNSPM